jgi:hypothetical protein
MKVLSLNEVCNWFLFRLAYQQFYFRPEFIKNFLELTNDITYLFVDFLFVECLILLRTTCINRCFTLFYFQSILVLMTHHRRLKRYSSS